MVTNEYKCILHYEAGREDRTYPSMVEAINAMQNAILAKDKPIFAEVILITIERVAYQSRLNTGPSRAF